MNQPDLAKTGLKALLDIFFDDTRNIAGLKWMEIKMIFELKAYRRAERRIRFGSRANDFFFLVASAHKKEGKKTFPALPSSVPNGIYLSNPNAYRLSNGRRLSPARLE